MEYSLHEEAPRVLVVDDEKVIREILSDFLTMEGFLVRTVEDGEAALAELKRRSYNLVISDLKMPNMGGLELLEQINEHNLNVLTVIMTGFGTVETAIEAMKKGAYDYILKPFKVEEVVHIVQRGLDRQRLQLENIRLKEALSLYKISEAISQSLSLDHILNLVIDTTLEEMKADMVTLMLQDGDDEHYFGERLRRCNIEGADEEDLCGELNIEEVLRFYAEDRPLLAHGAQNNRFFKRPPRSKRITSFCSIPLKERHRVIGMLNAYSYQRGFKFTEGQRKMLAIMGSRAAVSIENASLYENLLQSNQDLEAANLSLEENFRQTIVGFANAIEENDNYTRGHSERVSIYSKLIAEGMNLDAKMVDRVVLSAQVHDIGKIGIPTEKLNKAEKLTEEEFALLRTHPEKGKRILEPIPFLRDLVPGVYCHHERWDGNGYPQGLAGEDIPLLGRIIAVADSFDAMTSDRAYRQARPMDAALAEIKRCRGTQFDVEIADIFLEVMNARAESEDGVLAGADADAIRDANETLHPRTVAVKKERHRRETAVFTSAPELDDDDDDVDYGQMLTHEELTDPGTPKTRAAQRLAEADAEVSASAATIPGDGSMPPAGNGSGGNGASGKTSSAPLDDIATADTADGEGSQRAAAGTAEDEQAASAASSS
ncbi:MAG: response regulator [Myxococcales bacterium]|nr:response regulator [Myxococcales bacterium]